MTWSGADESRSGPQTRSRGPRTGDGGGRRHKNRCNRCHRTHDFSRWAERGANHPLRCRALRGDRVTAWGACRRVPKPCFGAFQMIRSTGFGRCGGRIRGIETASCFLGFLVPIQIVLVRRFIHLFVPVRYGRTGACRAVFQSKKEGRCRMSRSVFAGGTRRGFTLVELLVVIAI
ncbi:MAG: prepilin-type N-terminal cleavage/methylation domain-containing protein, partial [Planctomycetia bacterium]|nr:prepilin-type N-terminal cleavage/methylation domain-containing protein [Planctomycetia bacterium]